MSGPFDTTSSGAVGGPVARSAAADSVDPERFREGGPIDDDLALLRRFVDGDRDALGALASRHERDLLGIAQGLVGRSHAADVVQETWLRVIRHAHGFKGESGIRTWLWRITINGCRDLHEQRRRRRRREARPVTLPDGVASASVRDDDDDLIAALARLPAEQRELLILGHHHAGGLAVAADVLDIPLGTVKSRLHAARRALRDQLTKDGA